MQSTDTAHNLILGLAALDSVPNALLYPSSGLHESFIHLVKHYIDPLATENACGRSLRKGYDSRKTRKRKDPGLQQSLNAHRMHVVGVDIAQVWRQASRTLDTIEADASRNVELGDSSGPPSSVVNDGKPRPTTLSIEDSDPDHGANLFRDVAIPRVDIDKSFEQTLPTESGGPDTSTQKSGLDYSTFVQRSSLLEGIERPRHSRSLSDSGLPHVIDEFGLNDGFFSIDEFNKQSAFFERLDTEHLGSDNMSDDEGRVDWNHDPGLAIRDADPPNKHTQSNPSTAHSSTLKRTFEAVTAASHSSDESSVNSHDADHLQPSNLLSGQSAPERQRLPSSLIGEEYIPMRSENASTNREGEVSDLNVHRDLFEEETAIGVTSDGSVAREDVSSHDKRQSALEKSILVHEDANLRPKSWSLIGETMTHLRPMNSLLDKDLEFEWSGKPVPVTTAGFDKQIETLIEKRVVAMDFNELAKRRSNITDPRHEKPDRHAVDDAQLDSRLEKALHDEHTHDLSHVRRDAIVPEHLKLRDQWIAISDELDSLANLDHKPHRLAQVAIEIDAKVPHVHFENALLAGKTDVLDKNIFASKGEPKLDLARSGSYHTRGQQSILRNAESSRSRFKRKKTDAAQKNVLE